MKRLKINLALLAVIIGTTAAFASAPKPAATLYGFDKSSGLWIQPRAGSHCNTSPTEDCEAQFNGDPNNGGTEVPGTSVKGIFVY